MKCIIYCILSFLLFASISIADDYNFTIKLKGLPVDGIAWGSSPQQLKIVPTELECEQIKPTKEECAEYPRHCEQREECDYFILQDGRNINLSFTNNRLLFFFITSKPTNIAKELAYYKECIGSEPSKVINGDVSDIYIWGDFREQRLVCNKSTGKCTFEGSPRDYVEIATKQSAKEEFKILDLTLGHSTQKDFIQIANTNKWEFSYLKDYSSFYVHNIGFDGVVDAEFEFVDGKLESIDYKFGATTAKTDYFQMLSNKYGKPIEDNGSRVEWCANKDTRDEINIGYGYDKTHSKVKEIWYKHFGLGLKSSDESYLRYLEKSRSKEKVFQKAF